MEEDQRNTSKSSSAVVVAGGSEILSTGNSGDQEKEQIFSPLSIRVRYIHTYILAFFFFVAKLINAGAMAMVNLQEQESKKTCDFEKLKKDHNSCRRQSKKKSIKKRLGWLRMGC